MRRRRPAARPSRRPCRRPRGHGERGDRARGGPDRRAGPVGRQVQHRQPGQLAPPVRPAARPAPPRSASARCHTAKSAYCTGKRRQPVRLPRPGRLIQRGQLPAQDLRRPLIEHHVMHRQHQHMLTGAPAGPGTPGSPAPPPGRTAPPHRPPPASPPPRRGSAAPDTSATGSGNGDGGSITWYGTPSGPATSRVRSTSCRRVTAVSAAPSAATSTVPGSRTGDRHVVLGRAGLQLGQEPQPLLRERQRQPPVPRHRDHRRRRRARPSRRRSTAARPATVGWSNSAASGTSVPNTSRTREITRVASSECPPRSKKSSSAPTRSTPSTCAQIPASSSSVSPARRHYPSPVSGRPASGGGQRGPVQLPVRGQRQRGQLGEHRRDHELRQPPGQERPQLIRGRDPRGGIGRHQPGRQPGPVLLPGHRHRRRGHPRVAGQHRLHLTRLDPEPAHLDLLIDPPQRTPAPRPAATAPGPRSGTTAPPRH